MTGSQRCDEIIRLIDQVLGECEIPAPFSQPNLSVPRPPSCASCQRSPTVAHRERKSAVSQPQASGDPAASPRVDTV